MKVNSTLTLRIIAEIIVFFICLFLFAINAKDVVSSFYSQDSSIGISEIFHPSLPLPQITICPHPSTRCSEGKTSSNKAAFENASWSQEDLIHIDAHYHDWKVSKVKSVVQGQCFSLTAQHNVKALDITPLVLLNSNFTFFMYFHDPGDELWIWSTVFPVPLKQITITPPPMKNVGIAYDIHFKKRVSKYLNKQNTCKHYEPPSSFTSCAQAAMSTFVKTSIHCSHHLLYQFDPENESKPKECNNRNGTTGRIWEVDLLLREAMKFARQPDTFGCLKSCQQAEYDLTISTLEPGPVLSHHYTMVAFYYDTTYVSMLSEIPIYDTTRLIGGLGGSLGLYLGFSLFGVFKDLAAVVQRLKNK